MNKNKKTILIVIAIIVGIAIIAGLIWWFGFGMNGNDEGDKTKKLYTELEGKQEYIFRTRLDEQNEVYYAKKDNVAYLNIIYQGKRSKYVIKDGNTYLLVDDEKVYYTYQNNETDLYKIEHQLSELKDKKYTQGKEKIEDKEYQYEEYEGVTGFVLRSVDTEEAQTAKTRFYYNGDKLVYIKTIIGAHQELLKVDMSYAVDNNLFEIPEEYKEV